MAVVNRVAPGDLAPLASLGLLACLALSLVGIKIWWFKHRLHFDQSSTSNGAVGGSQPRVAPPRTRHRSSKDKRLSQQFREPVDVHGVFRKRQEDELDPEPPRPLPPVRPRKHSRSSSGLFQPSAPPPPTDPAIPNPPTREPPVPPVRRSRSVAPREEEQKEESRSPPSPAGNEDVELKASEEVQPAQGDLPEMTPEPAPEPPAAAQESSLEASGPRFLKMKTSPEKAKPAVNLTERRATGFLRPSDEDWQHLHLEEVEHEAKAELRELEDFRDERVEEAAPFESSQVRAKSVQFQVQDDEEEEEDGEDGPGHRSKLLTQRRPTGYVHDVAQLLTDLDEDDPEARAADSLWREMESELRTDFGSNIEEEFDRIRHSYEANEERFLEDEEAKEEEGGREPRRPTGFGKSIDEDWESFEQLEQEPNPIKERRPTGYARQTAYDEEPREAPGKPRVTFDVADEEEATAGAGEASSFIKQRRPTGFVRDVDEIQRQMRADDDEEEEGDFEATQPTVNFQLDRDMDDDDDDDQTETHGTSLIKQRRPTGFVRDGVDLTSPQWDEGDSEDGLREPRRVAFELDDETEADVEQTQTQPSILKQRRPTGFVRRDEVPPQDPDEVEDEAADEEELVRRPKPRQKVTFRFSTEPRSPTPEAEGDDEDDDEASREMPKPMQRLTKTRTENTAALLFSTQVSAEYAAAADAGFNDSWSAIRQHRHLTEELQQLTLEVDAAATEPAAPRPAPQPAYRNPLAQLAASSPGSNTPEARTDPAHRPDEVGVAKPRTLRDMRRAQAQGQFQQMRHTEHVSATEA